MARTLQTLPTVQVLENDQVRVRISSDFRGVQIHGEHLKDSFNLPTFFTLNKRGLLKQWEVLESRMTADLTYHGAIEVLSMAGAKVHSYCAMD